MQSYFHLSELSTTVAWWGSNRVLVFPGRLDENILRTSLLQTLKRFPGLNGRLLRENTSGRYVVVEGNYGADFSFNVVEDVTLSQALEANLGEAVMKDERFEQFFPSAGTGVGWTSPLVLVRATLVLPVEYTILAITLSHALCDGHSTAMFLRCWNDLATKQQSEIIQLSFRIPNYKLLNNQQLETRFARLMIQDDKNNDNTRYSYEKQLFQLQSEAMKTHVRSEIQIDGPKFKLLHAKLSAKLEEEKSWISTSEVAFALIAAGSLLAKKSNTISARFVIDLRQRTPLFPHEQYVGNALARPFVQAQVENKAETTTTGFDWLVCCAKTLHELLRKTINDEQLLTDYFASYELAQRHPEVKGLFFDKMSIELLQSNGFHFNSWKPFGECFKYDFGSGIKPVYMSNTPKYKNAVIPRMCLFLPNRADGTSTMLLHLTPEESQAVHQLCAKLQVLA